MSISCYIPGMESLIHPAKISSNSTIKSIINQKLTQPEDSPFLIENESCRVYSGKMTKSFFSNWRISAYRNFVEVNKKDPTDLQLHGILEIMKCADLENKVLFNFLRERIINNLKTKSKGPHFSVEWTFLPQAQKIEPCKINITGSSVAVHELFKAMFNTKIDPNPTESKVDNFLVLERSSVSYKKFFIGNSNIPDYLKSSPFEGRCNSKRKLEAEEEYKEQMKILRTVR